MRRIPQIERICITKLLTIACVGALVAFFAFHPTNEGKPPDGPLHLAGNADFVLANPSNAMRRLGAGANRSSLTLSLDRRAIEELGITPQELRETQDMESRERQGEFILQNERPTVRKFMDADFRSITESEFQSRKRSYDQVFLNAGVSSNMSMRLQRHLQKIHLAALEVEVTISQLMDARLKYEAALRKTLSAESYRRYKDFELMKNAHREFLVLTNSAGSLQVALLNESDCLAILQLIKKFEGYSRKDTRGPFDDLPEIAMGKEAVLSATENSRNRLMRAVVQIQQAMASQEISDAAQIMVLNHYSNRIGAHEEAIRRLSTKKAETDH